MCTRNSALVQSNLHEYNQWDRSMCQRQRWLLRDKRSRRRPLTFVQSLVGHAVDVARAALGDQPLHHGVDAGPPVRAPHAPAVGRDNARLLAPTPRKKDGDTRSGCPPGLTPDGGEVPHTDRAAGARVQVPADLKVGMVRAGPAKRRLDVKEAADSFSGR